MIEITQEFRDWYYYDVLECIYAIGELQMHQEVYYEESTPSELKLEVEKIDGGWYKITDNSMNIVLVVEDFKRDKPIDRYPIIKSKVDI